MKIARIAMMAGLLAASIAGAAGKKSLQQKIVGGVEASAREFPYIVSLQAAGFGHYCGGSLIDREWVLTAAHCVSGESSVTVVIGLHDRANTAGTETFTSKKIIVHPNYSGSDYDIALVQLNGRSTFPTVNLAYQELAAINDDEAAPEAAQMSTVAGWGVTSENGMSLPARLRKVDVPLVSRNTCLRGYPGRVTARMICAGYSQGGKDSCQGDSGGPLVADTNQGRVLIGVVSWGEGCARPGKYGVYANVAHFYNWIQQSKMVEQ